MEIQRDYAHLINSRQLFDPTWLEIDVSIAIFSTAVTVAANGVYATNALRARDTLMHSR